MKCYGIPNKIGLVDIIHNFYNNSRCAMRSNGQMEWFQMVTGVRQGCILSPLILDGDGLGVEKSFG